MTARVRGNKFYCIREIPVINRIYRPFSEIEGSLKVELHVLGVSVYYSLYVTVKCFSRSGRFSLHSDTRSYLHVTLKMEVVMLLE